MQQLATRLKLPTSMSRSTKREQQCLANKTSTHSTIYQHGHVNKGHCKRWTAALPLDTQQAHGEVSSVQRSCHVRCEHGSSSDLAHLENSAVLLGLLFRCLAFFVFLQHTLRYITLLIKHEIINN